MTMKTIFDHIEYVKGKPHHVRRGVAFGVAAGTSALIALAWFAGSLASGAFAIRGATFATSAGQGGVVATTSASDSQGLAGVGAATFKDQAPAHIEIVETTPPTKVMRRGPTILPF